MSGLQYFFWLAEQAFGFLALEWPITLVLLVCLAATLVNTIRKRRLNVRNAAWSMLPIVGPLLLLTWGVVFEDAGRGTSDFTWEAKAVYGLLLAQIPIAALAIWRAVEARLFAAAAAALISLYSLASALMAVMSVTSDWL